MIVSDRYWRTFQLLLKIAEYEARYRLMLLSWTDEQPSLCGRELFWKMREE